MTTLAKFPGSAFSSSGGTDSNENWVNADQIRANDGVEAQITAATFDSPDRSFRLIAHNFTFGIPAGATIDGVEVEVERRCFAGSAIDSTIRLRSTSGTLMGENKGDGTAWPGTATIRTYGGPTDKWGATLTPAVVNSSAFGVFVSCQATAADTDVGVDFVRMTIYYTESGGNATRAMYQQRMRRAG